MPDRINRAVELLKDGQAIYYDGAHSGHVLTYAQGRADAAHLGRLHQCRHGARLVRHGGARALTWRHGRRRGRPARGTARRRSSSRRRSTARTRPTFASMPGSSGRFWPAACTASAVPSGERATRCGPSSNAAAIRTSSAGRTPPCPARRTAAAERRAASRRSCSASASGAAARKQRGAHLGAWTRRNTCGAATLGRSTRRVSCCSASSSKARKGWRSASRSWTCPGLGFAELGPGDLGLSLGYVEVQRFPYPPEMREARERVLAACRPNGIASSKPARPRPWPHGLTRVYGWSPAIAKTRRGPGARTSVARCQRRPSGQPRRNSRAELNWFRTKQSRPFRTQTSRSLAIS